MVLLLATIPIVVLSTYTRSETLIVEEDRVQPAAGLTIPAGGLEASLLEKGELITVVELELVFRGVGGSEACNLTMVELRVENLYPSSTPEPGTLTLSGKDRRVETSISGAAFLNISRVYTPCSVELDYKYELARLSRPYGALLLVSVLTFIVGAALGVLGTMLFLGKTIMEKVGQ